VTYTKTIDKNTPVYTADSINQKYDTAFMLTSGHQRRQADGAIDRWVHLSIRGQGFPGEWVYAYTQVTPDEARSLAAMLLDAADDADERMG